VFLCSLKRYLHKPFLLDYLHILQAFRWKHKIWANSSWVIHALSFANQHGGRKKVILYIIMTATSKQKKSKTEVFTQSRIVIRIYSYAHCLQLIYVSQILLSQRRKINIVFKMILLQQSPGIQMLRY
jgi:hypothetical protein